MKNRSNRLSISEAHEDWVDGSWTVDCVCGVNFDDGEEMVDCDECGVWVHTRCSSYVKSEKSFACDKCKNRKNGSTGVVDDSEETEVAEFLLELPTKTLRMSNSNPASASSRKPARLWTETPMEERVHVQGVPGGDPGLFSGVKMLSIFGPELWKATGYVPKKFNFRYPEFPSSSDGEVEEKKEDFVTKRSEENGNQGDNNAVVLSSLSKEGENTLPTPTVGLKSPEGGVCYEKMAPRQRKKSDKENDNLIPSEDNLNDGRLGQPILLHCGKRKKDAFGASKDHSAKKKARSNEKGGDGKKQVVHASKEDGGLKVNNGIQCGRDVLGEQQSYGLGERATNLAYNGCGLDASLGKAVSSDGISKKGNKNDRVPVRPVSLSDSGNKVSDLNSGSLNVDEEGQDIIPSFRDIGGGTGVGSSSHNKESLVGDVTIAGSNAKESKHGHDLDIEETSSYPNKKWKAEVDVDDFGSLPLDRVKLNTAKPASQRPESSDYVFSENCKVIISSGSEAGDHRVDADNKNPNVAIFTKTDQSDDSLSKSYNYKRELTGSEGSMGARKRSAELAHTSEVAKEMLKSSNAVTTNSTPYQRKVVVSMGKSTTSASTISKFSDNHLAPTTQNLTIDSKKKDLSESTVETTKDNSANDLERDAGKCGRPRKFVKESSRLNSPSETSQSTKLSQTLDSKKISSDSKEFTTHSSFKVPLISKVKAAPGSVECAHPTQVDGSTSLQSKTAGSFVPSKAEKFYHSGSYPSSRVNVTSVAAPSSSNVPAALSDEELAFLLHQELNSSPRVPRVPRMRHTGSLPQLASPTATSMLMKRTSSSGGKDHGMSSRRAVKDFSRDGSHHSQEREKESKKMDRKPSSPERRRDTGRSLDRLSRREINGGSDKGVHSMKMRKATSSLSSSDANGRNLSSSHPTSRNSSDDDTLGHPTRRTLPGLIAEIMSEGKRMTYEELCNAVLPHWPHLRKHNGERYAYSSHSQAVLDCLRNRSEWARLVDRGPKTSGSRKRRKFDIDSLSIDSEDNEDSRGKDVGSKSFESQQEEFPKGKRKARTRGRLTLPGRGIVRRRRRADVVSDDDSESFSNSSEDSMSSEEEIQGSGASIVGNETSSSSEEVL